MLLIVIIKASCRVDGSRRHVVRRLTNAVSSAAIMAMAANICDVMHICEHDIITVDFLGIILPPCHNEH